MIFPVDSVNHSLNNWGQVQFRHHASTMPPLIQVWRWFGWNMISVSNKLINWVWRALLYYYWFQTIFKMDFFQAISLNVGFDCVFKEVTMWWRLVAFDFFASKKLNCMMEITVKKMWQTGVLLWSIFLEKNWQERVDLEGIPWGFIDLTITKFIIECSLFLNPRLKPSVSTSQENQFSCLPFRQAVTVMFLFV